MAYSKKLTVQVDATNNASEVLKSVQKDVKGISKETTDMGSEVQSSWKKMSDSILGGINEINRAMNGLNRVTRHYNTMMGGFNRGVINLFQEAGEFVYDFTSDAIDNFTALSEQHARTLGAMANNYDNTARSQAKFMEDAQKLKEQAMDLGMFGVTGTGSLTDAKGVSAMQTEIVKAGITNPDEILTATKTLLTFAQANQLDTGSAVEFAIPLANQFDIPIGEWDDMLDKVSHTADLSMIDVSDIVQSTKYASGISSGVGKSLEEVLGMIGVLGDFGIRGSQAGSSIQALLTRILTGDTTVITDAQAEIAPPKAMEAFYRFEEMAKPNGELLPMDQVVGLLEEEMSDMNDAEQAWFAKKLFGLYQMKGAYALLGGDADALAETIENITNDSEGTNINKLNQILESQHGQLTSLNNMWEGIKTDMGDRVNPIVDAIRDELFNFLSNNGNYEINFNNLRTALEQSADLIEEKYGSAIADALRNVGGLAIDFSEVLEGVAPEFGAGILDVLSRAIKFDVPGTIGEWNEMISDMRDAAGDLPDDLRDMGTAVVDVIDLFGKLAAFNLVMQGVEGATNLVLLVTNMSTALSTIVDLLGGIPGLILTVGGIATVLGVNAVGNASAANIDTLSVKRGVFQLDDYDSSKASTTTTTGMRAKMDEFLSSSGISSTSDVATLLTSEMDKYVYEQSLSGKSVTVDEYDTVLSGLYSRYMELISGDAGYYNASGRKLSSGNVDNTAFGAGLYKFDANGNRIDSSKTTLYSELYDYITEKTGSGKRTGVIGDTYVTYRDNGISMDDKFGAGFSSNPGKYGFEYTNGDIMGGILNANAVVDSYIADWYNGWISNLEAQKITEAEKSEMDRKLSNRMLSNSPILDGVMDMFTPKSPYDGLSTSNRSTGMSGLDGLIMSASADNRLRGFGGGGLYGINGWAALSDEGRQRALMEQNQLSDNIQFAPNISVAAPTVNVDVTVDKSGNVDKTVSILDPNFNNNMNTWYNRNLSQYGRTNK